MGFVQGDPARHPDRGVRGGHRGRGARPRSRRWRRGGRASASATPRTSPTTPAEQQSIWKLRKAGLGLLLGHEGRREADRLRRGHRASTRSTCPSSCRASARSWPSTDATAPTTATARSGCLHIRPVIDLKTPRGLEQVRAIADEITDLVLEFGGTISSEHGDGRARSPFLERMYGPTHDPGVPRAQGAPSIPKNRMNPGNIVDSPGVTEHLRYGADVQDVGAEDAARLLGAGRLRGRRSRCATASARAARSSRARCAPRTWPRKDEEHSTRGRANALRAVLSGAGAAGRVHGQAALRGDGPLPRVQGLQGRVPVQRGHGEDEVRVPAPLLPGQRAAAAQPAVRPHRAAVNGCGSRLRADLQLDRAPRRRTAG